MIGTAIWRIKEAYAVLIGKKKTEQVKTPPLFSEKTLQNLPTPSPNDETKKYINSKRIEFFFLELGEERVNAGGNDNLGKHNRLDPSYTTLKNYFPNAKFIVYADFDLNVEGVELRRIPDEILNKFEPHPRRLYRITNYMKFFALTHSQADISICIDTDMFVVSDNIYKLIKLTDKFGFCVPESSGLSMNYEVRTSLDTYPITDDSGGFGTAVNITPLTLKKSDERGMKYYTAAMHAIARKGSRASIAMWTAAWETGCYPYMIPKEFCLCRGSEGVGNEVILHVGHKSVADYYNVKI